MIEQSRLMDAELRKGGQATGSSSSSEGKPNEGYWDYMQRQLNERTQKLGTLSESMDKLEETSSSWANETSKFVQRQKRNLVLGAVKNRFGV
jgi:syntaxin-binding protein 5